ncbi:MAG: VWA domain-containing protein [Acidobacteriota bacterium]|nr:VWA domain-containing protein [Acidobacteriota bacterium]
MRSSPCWLVFLLAAALSLSLVPKGSAATGKEAIQDERKQKKNPKRQRATLVPTKPSESTVENAEEASTTQPEPTVEKTPAEPEPVERAGDPPPPPRAAPDRSRAVVEERVDVTEVLLDVLVTDRQGEIIAGLGADDFLVEENGRRVDVTSVAFYGTRAQLQSEGRTGATRSDRYFMLFFHDQSMEAPGLRAVQMDLARWVKRWASDELEPNDQVAVLAYDVRLRVYTDFTRDTDTLLKAIDRAATGRREPDWSEFEPDPTARDSPSLLLNLPQGKDLRRETRIFQKTLGLVAHAAEGIVGRKNLVLFSLGFGDARLGFWTPDSRWYGDMEQSLNAGNVAVYPVEILSPRRSGPAGPGLAGSLSSIAEDTGGVYYDSFVNFMTPLRELAEDNLGYYLLSYSSEYPSRTSGYREVEVSVPDKHRADVRHRRGYRYGGW